MIYITFPERINLETGLAARDLTLMYYAIISGTLRL
jgi:hypothetical protein